MSLDENSKRLFYERIDSNNINIFRTQNSLIFPVIYPESFYKNILSSWGTSAFLGTLCSLVFSNTIIKFSLS